jgi:hypothetical protein
MGRDPRNDYGEQRIQALGRMDGTFYVVAYTTDSMTSGSSKISAASRRSTFRTSQFSRRLRGAEPPGT